MWHEICHENKYGVKTWGEQSFFYALCRICAFKIEQIDL